MAQYKTYSTMSSDKNSDQQVIHPEVEHIESLEDRNDIINKNNVVVIYYYADWCGPCKQFANRFNTIAHELSKPGVVFVKEDIVLELRNTPNDPTVVPTFHFYKNGVFQNDKVMTGVNEKDIVLTVIEMC
jgi:thioredoxin 1